MATSASSATASLDKAGQDYIAASQELLVKHEEIAAKGAKATFAEKNDLSELYNRVYKLYSQALYSKGALLKDESYDDVVHHRYNERLEIVSHYKKLNARLLGIDFPQNHPINLLFQALVNKNPDQAKIHFLSLNPETQATACFYAYAEQRSMNPEAKSEGHVTIIYDPIYALNKRCLYSQPVISVLINEEFTILKSKIDSEKQTRPLEKANTIEQTNANTRAKVDYYREAGKLKKHYRAIASAVDAPSQNEIDQIEKLTATVRDLYQQALQQNQEDAWLPYNHQRLEALLNGQDLPDDHPVIQLERALSVDIEKDKDAILKAFNALDRSTKKIAYKMAYQNDTRDYKESPSDYWNECGTKLINKDPMQCLTQANNQYHRVIDFLVKNEFELLQAKKNQ